MDRRQFLSATTVSGTALLTGCSGSTDTQGSGTDSGTPGDSTETATSGTGGSTTGSFRLLISDRPAAIGDFDSLDVTFDRARVHRQQSGDDEAESDEDTETERGTATADDTETATATATATESDDDDGERGFTVFDLDEPTVDLTRVVGEKAIGVLDGELETGQYSKIELYVSEVDGIVDGESVAVKVPSEKLQIQSPFEITADGTVEFVFDITVVEKGNGGYNLLPVISESGVAGEDVDVEEVDGEDDQTTESRTETAASGTDTSGRGTEPSETATDA